MEVSSITTNPPAKSLSRPAGQTHSTLPGSLTAIALAGDVIAVALALLASFWLRFHSGWITFGVALTKSPDLDDYIGLFVVGTVLMVGLLAHGGAYDWRQLLRYRRTAYLVARATAIWFALYLGASLTLKFDPPISRIYAAASGIAGAIALLGWRAGLNAVLQREAVASRLRTRVIFVGWNAESTSLCQSIFSDSSHPYDVIGCVPSAEGRFAVRPPSDVPVLGDYNDLTELLQNRVAHMVVVADLDPTMGEMVSLANLCERHFIQFKVIPSYFQILVSGLELETISGVPVLGVTRLPLDRLFNRFLKRCVDIPGAIVGLLLSAPLFLYCAWRIRREDPGNVFFGQERIGRNGQAFTMWKLRSMRLGSERFDHINQSTLREDPRVLPVGRWMRRWNIDETPQFWNVLKGDMSLVGPRPERTLHSEKLSFQIAHYNARYTAKPGITGWAQIHGLRGDTDLAERVRYDIYYLENWSLLLDLQIMVMTFFRRDNAY